MEPERIRVGPLTAVIEIPYELADNLRYPRYSRELVSQGEYWLGHHIAHYGWMPPQRRAYRRFNRKLKTAPWHELFFKRTKYIAHRFYGNIGAVFTCYVFSESYFVFLIDSTSGESAVYVFDTNRYLDQHWKNVFFTRAAQAAFLKALFLGYVDAWPPTASKTSKG